MRPLFLTPHTTFMSIIVDAHEDLAWNVVTFGRDFTRSALEIRQIEKDTSIPVWNEGECLLGWPEYQRGQVAVVFGTLFAAPRRRQIGDWDRVVYSTAEEAHRLYLEQVAVYQRMEDEHPDQFRRVLSRADLEAVLAEWEKPAAAPEDPEDTRPVGHPLGLVTLMEGAEGVRSPYELSEWWEAGVRIIGPAWAGTRFCGGTREPGPLTHAGHELLAGMADLGFTLDLSHMDVQSALEALDEYGGPILASHANPAALLKGVESNRHLPDRVIDGLLERDGVIGIVIYNKFLVAGWRNGDRKDLATLQTVANAIDYICQRAGDAHHVGIGSDFEGGFGMQGTPAEIHTVADLQKLVPFLAEKGYSSEDIDAILGGNWLNHLRKTLPEK